MNTRKLKIIVSLGTLLLFAAGSIAEVKEVKPRISLRSVTIKNIASSSSGKYIALPNCVSTGSIGIFKLSPERAITSLPSRFSEKDFYRARGVFYYAGKKDSLTDMVFLPLQEFSNGYSVSFSNQGDTLAISGGNKITLYAVENWSLYKTISLDGVTRTVFAPNNSKIAAITDGRIYVMTSPNFSTSYTIEPASGCKFADMAFSNDGTKIAAYEYKTTSYDHPSRIRIFLSENGNEDRQLPVFAEKISNTPGNHFPLVSYLANDSALAVSLEKAFIGKTTVIKSNDGTPIKDFKGSCFAISQNGSLFAAGGEVYQTETWKKIGSFGNSSLCLSLTNDNYLLSVTEDNFQRFKIIP